FPAFAENYASFLERELFRRERSAHALLVARLIVELNSRDGQCGFNRLMLANAADVRDSELLIAEVDYQFYLNARLKYEEYSFYLAQSKDFGDEWRAIKAAFPRQTQQEGIIRRSFLP